MDVNNIACPVLAALYSAGYFVPDKYGRLERIQVQAGIAKGLGWVHVHVENVSPTLFGSATELVGFGFAENTAGYRADGRVPQSVKELYV